ncbi:uncharacterized protein IUM83_01965 [Phytophthora cinnamomi]|uniref:uncharacterized protein n=1 Tax=Phytophthora cinnamomi TaxID=4785 RepID=UPI00355AA838|nr:hypothetical protein IUM83_01965 [Phytophthora cinnamomi]
MAQIRYRKKIHDHACTLEKDVALLREEIQVLESQCMRISHRILENTTPFNVAAEWFRLFRYGLNGYVPRAELYNPSGSGGPCGSITQREFVLATMTEDVAVHAGRGIDALLEGWRLASITWPDFDVQVLRCEIGPGDSVVITCKISVVIAENTLRHVFPNLGECKRGKVLASKLLGQAFVINSSTVFQWNKKQRRIESVLHNSDLFTPMMEFLANLDDLAFVFGDARITSECRVILERDA